MIPDLVKMLADIMRAEEAKYYKIAAMEVFNFLLTTYRGSLNEHIVYIFRTVLVFLKSNCRNSLFDWEDNSLVRKKEILSKVRSINKENSKIEQIFE